MIKHSIITLQNSRIQIQVGIHLKYNYFVEAVNCKVYLILFSIGLNACLMNSTLSIRGKLLKTLPFSISMSKTHKHGE